MRVLYAALGSALCCLLLVLPAAAQTAPADWAGGLSSMAPPLPDFQQPISQFSGTILVPTKAAHFFDGYQLHDASGPDAPEYNPGYGINLTIAGYVWPNIRLVSTLGQQMFAAASAVPYDCTADETYCAFNERHDEGLFSPADQPGDEKFSGLSVNGNAAVVTALLGIVRSWAVDWYDASVDQSFTLGVAYQPGSGAASRLGVPASDNLDPSDRVFAEDLAAVASALVPVRTLPSVPAVPASDTGLTLARPGAVIRSTAKVIDPRSLISEPSNYGGPQIIVQGEVMEVDCYPTCASEVPTETAVDLFAALPGKTGYTSGIEIVVHLLAPVSRPNVGDCIRIYGTPHGAGLGAGKHPVTVGYVIGDAWGRTAQVSSPFGIICEAP